MKNEMAAALTGPPTAPRNCAFTANCTGTAIPATRATNTKARCVLVILLPVVAVARTLYPYSIYPPSRPSLPKPP
jgi:hypothetical protein